MKLYKHFVVLSLLCSTLQAEDDAFGKDSLENIDEQLVSNKLKLEEMEKELVAEEQQLNVAIDSLEKSVKSNQHAYTTGAIRSMLLNIFPTLCLPEEQITGAHSVQIGHTYLEVLCNGDTYGPGWLVIYSRNDNSSVHRSYREYKTGFGYKQDEGSYFIGLEKLFSLLSIMPHELIIHVESTTGETRFAKYDHFKIANEYDGYRLTSLGSYSGNAENSFSFALKYQFTCLRGDSAGDSCWWIKNYGYAVNRQLSPMYPKWWGWPEKDLKSMQMQIRPKLSITQNCDCKEGKVEKKKWYHISNWL